MALQRLFYGGLAILGGLVLLESLFLPWYRLDIEVAGVTVGSKQSAWQTMAAMDLLLLLTALAAIAGGAAVIRRADLSLIVFAAGVAGLVLSTAGLLDLPEASVSAVPGDTTTVGRELGAFIALIASAGVAYGGFRAGTVRGDARPRSRRTTAARAHASRAASTRLGRVRSGSPTRTAAPPAGRAARPGGRAR
jgi:hypothetical protein